MRHIREVLADIMCDIEQRAGAKPARIDGDHRNRLEGKAGDPRAQTDRENGCAIAQPEGVASETGEIKMTPAPIGEAAGAKKGPKRRGGNGVLTSRRETTPSTMLRNMRVTSPNGSPRPVARIFLVTVDGKRVHQAALANSPKSSRAFAT